MGLERISSILQDKRSNYDIDLFVPILNAAAKRAGSEYGKDREIDFSLRVIADHARAFCFLTADGVVPANDKRGYVLRRLLRRAIRHGRKLGIEEPFLHEVTPFVVEALGDHYPELLAAQEAVLEVGRVEERRFADTLSTGLQVLEESLGGIAADAGERPVLPGKELFLLYDTFGFPLDLARDIAEERGIELDEAGFEAEMAKQRARAQASWKKAETEEVAVAYAELARTNRSRFAGYGVDRLDGVPVLALLRAGRPVEALSEGAEGEVVLEQTPFYAEAGGQVADTGYIAAPSGHAEVVDVQRPAEGLIVHRVRLESGELTVGESVTAEIDVRRRDATRRNHTATHLLHAALREVVTHVKQAGSLVAPDRLRFDFTHFSALQDQALADIELLVNRKVLEDLPVETLEMDLDEALQAGAMALFGERYGGRVRVVRVGDFSLELCGGTHTRRSGEIGLIKLSHERGIASGTRRVEAMSGEGSLAAFREDHRVVRALEEQLSVPRELVMDEIEKRLDRVRSIQRELEEQRLLIVRERLSQKADEAETVAGIRVLTERVEGLGPQEMRELADSLRGKLDSGVVVLGRSEAGKASLLVAVTADLKKRLPAGDLVRSLGKIIGGGGGGRPDMAEAGGKNPERLDEALRQAPREVARRMEASPSTETDPASS
jgi:alanyl-tRNA synthetase